MSGRLVLARMFYEEVKSLVCRDTKIQGELRAEYCRSTNFKHIFLYSLLHKFFSFSMPTSVLGAASPFSLSH